MAIYQRTYNRYTGPLTARPLRLLIPIRYTYAHLLQSKFLILFLALCLVYPIGCVTFIYITHNPKFMALIHLGGGSFTNIDNRFFYYFCVVQGAMAYLLTAFVGPGLVAPDLADRALPLYFCRPFSRAEYIVGKLCVLGCLLSLITWVPGLLLFFIQSSLAGAGWMTAHWWIAGALIFGMGVWILVISLVALALSAWIKWRIAAGGAILAVFFAGAGFGSAINNTFHTNRGSLIDLVQVVHTVWANLFRYTSITSIPLIDAWIVLAAASALSLWILIRRLRAFEVIR